MSKTVDERVVEMRFDNSQFESNVKTSMNTLERLKASMKFDKTAESLKGIDKAAKNVKFDGLVASVSNIESRFSILGIAGKRAIENITDSMMTFAKKTTSFLTSGIINGGISRAMKLEQAHFQLQGLLKDEREVTAVMKNVNDAVDGTAYGLDAAATIASQLAASGMKAGDQMYKSLRAVAGVAAMTNSSYEDIGRIFTQVSGQGRLMGQDLLQLSSRGINAAATIAKYLGKTEAEVRDMVSKGQISFEIFAAAMDDAFGEHAKKANETFTGAMANVKASLARIGAEFISPLIVQNGPLVKFFNVLRERINDIKNNIGPLAEMFIGSVTEMANGATKALKNLDLTNYVKGFVNIVKTAANILKGFWGLIKPIGQAFLDIFPPKASESILKSTENIKKMTDAFRVSDETADKMRRTFKGVFSIIDMIMKAASAVGKVLVSFFTSGIVTGIIDFVLSITAAVGDFITALNDNLGFGSLTKLFTGLSEVVGDLLNGFSGIGDAFSGVGDAIVKVVTGVGKTLKSTFSWIIDKISLGDIFTGLLGGGAYVVIKKIIELAEKLKDIFSGGLLSLMFGFGDKEGGVGGALKIGKAFSDVLGAVKDSLQAFTSGIKIGSLVAIAAAIAILASALNTISQIKAVNITKSLFAIGIMFGMLTTSFKSVSKTLDLFAGKGIVKAGLALMMMAKAIGILADTMKEMSGLSLSEIMKGLIGIGGSVTALALGLKAIDGVKVKISTIIAINIMAKAIKTIAGSLVELGKMSWGEIARGLSAMGGALVELLIALKVMEKLSGLKSLAGAASLVLAVQSLDEIAGALVKIGKLSWGEIARGLSGMGGALAEIAGITGALGKLAGFAGLLGATSISTVTKGLSDIADALSKIGMMSWGEIFRGLSGLGGALTEIAGISGAVGKLAGFSGLLGSGTILIAVQGLDKIADALTEIGSLTWGEIAHGLTGMGGALLELGGISGALGYLTNIAGLLGAATIWVAVQGLEKLANAFVKFGSMSWGEIAHGLTGMAGALIEVGGISGALGYLTNIAGLLGAGTIWVAVQGLEKLANALKKFGDMSWGEIGHGLTAMGATLGELALGSLLNTLSGLGASAIAEVAEPLGKLADSVKKWSGVTIPENLGKQLGSLATGVMKFTFGGFGASTISTIAEPLGVMADSVKKWSGVTIPENLGSQLRTLANGIEAFTFSGLGGLSLAASAEPLGKLASSVKKWNGVSVPENLSTQLKGLASGVKAFTQIGDISSITNNISKFSNIINMLGVIDYVTISSGLNAIINSFKNLKTLLSGFDGSGVYAFQAALTALGTASVNGLVNALTESYGRVQSAAAGLMRAMAAGFNVGKFTLIVSLVATLNQCVSTITSRGPAFLAGGLRLGMMLSNGLKLGTITAKLALLVTMMQCVSGVRSYYGSFYSAGAYLTRGLANGIRSGKSSVAKAAREVANAAVKAAQAALDEHSPSKVFYKIGAFIPKGMANGIAAFADLVSSGVVSMAKTTIDNTKSVIGSMSSAISSASDVDIAPTVCPVLDMSQLQNGSYQLASSVDLAINKPIDLLSNAMYGAQAEIIQSNLDVVEAIHGLKDDIVGGVRTAITDAFGELAKEPAIIEVQNSIDGKQFAKSTVEYYQNEVSKRSVRANRSRGIL